MLIKEMHKLKDCGDDKWLLLSFNCSKKKKGGEFSQGGRKDVKNKFSCYCGIAERFEFCFVFLFKH